jgi:uncharacterized membrane protein YccC
MPGSVVGPSTFTTPGGMTIPLVAMIVCAGLAAGATREQLLGGFAALAAGAVMYRVAAAPRH